MGLRCYISNKLLSDVDAEDSGPTFFEWHPCRSRKWATLGIVVLKYLKWGGASKGDLEVSQGRHPKKCGTWETKV